MYSIWIVNDNDPDRGRKASAATKYTISEENLFGRSHVRKEDYDLMSVIIIWRGQDDMHSAEKGAGSVEYSMKWLSALTKIVIDQNRCPNCAREFLAYEYDQDKDGYYISGYVDADNHCIDSVRYALNRIWRKKGN